MAGRVRLRKGKHGKAEAEAEAERMQEAGCNILKTKENIFLVTSAKRC